ncbi:MAG: CARDB domain-containing protein [Candidatus Micrarchaeota archaeon]
MRLISTAFSSMLLVSLFVPVAWALPDMVSLVSISANNVPVGQSVVVSVTTTNAGNTAAAESYTRMCGEGSCYPYTVPPLNPGQSGTSTHDFVCPEGGSFSWHSNADEGEWIAESNEDNNEYQVFVECIAPPRPTARPDFNHFNA